LATFVVVAAMYHVEHFVLHQRTAGGEIDFLIVEFRDPAGHFVLEFVRAFLGNDVDRTRKCRAAEQCRLRAFDHFDALYDVERERQN